MSHADRPERRTASSRARPRPSASPWPGLHDLLDLINDALTGSGTRPVWAVATGPDRTSGLALSSTLDSPAAGRSSSLLDKPARLPDPARDPEHADELGGGSGDNDVLDGDIDGEHVETWRLVRLAQAGDGDAFGQLYDRYVDSVFRFIYYRVNDRALAEDFTSETFVRALRRISTITYQGRDIGAWFVTIARNIVLDHVKSARHRLETTTGETIESPVHAQSTESAVLESLASEQLMTAVAELGDEQRECVMLRFMQGLSVSETAAVMGKNDGAIKALQHRAVRKLADLIGDDLR